MVRIGCGESTEVRNREYQNFRKNPEWKIPLFRNQISCVDTDYFLFLLFFCYRDDDRSDDESDSGFDNMHKHDEYSHSEIINRCNFGSKHFINARLSSQTCLQHQADSSTQNAIPQCLNSKDLNTDHGTEDTIKTFPTMLKLIGGTLVGGVKYSDLYIDSDEDEDTSSTSSYVNKSDKDHGKNMQCKIPTLPQIA